MVITYHNDMLRTERMNPERYTRKGFGLRHPEMATAKVLSQQTRQKKTQQQTGDQQTSEQPPLGDVKNVNVKTANKSIRVMKQEAQKNKELKGGAPGIGDDDSEEKVLESVLVQTVYRTLLEKMSKSDPEYKIFN